MKAKLKTNRLPRLLGDQKKQSGGIVIPTELKGKCYKFFDVVFYKLLVEIFAELLWHGRAFGLSIFMLAMCVKYQPCVIWLSATLAQLGERQTEDLKASCSIHEGRIFFKIFPS